MLSMNNNEKKHIIYYTFLRPLEKELKELIKEDKGITLSRTFEGICSCEEFQFCVSEFAKKQSLVKGLLSSVSYFGENKDIPVFTITSEDILKLHKKIMTTLLHAGSPYLGNFLHKGYCDIEFNDTNHKLTENPYNPHIALEKICQEKDIIKFEGKEFSCGGIYTRVKRFGIWDEHIQYHSFKSD